MQDNKYEFSFNFLELIELLWLWRKKLIMVSLIAAVVSAVVSFMVTEKFESNMVFYPTVGNSFSSSYLKQSSGSKGDPLEFGSETEVEEMLQILNSDLMKGEIIKRFDLMKYYKLDENDFQRYKKLDLLLKKNISFKRTDYTSIEVKVLDESPEMASKIVDGVSELIDSIKTSIQRQVAMQALAVVERSYLEKSMEIKTIDDSLDVLGKLGIYNSSEHAKALTDLLAKGGGNTSAILKQQELLARYGNSFETLSRRKFLEQEKETNLREKYMQAKVDAEASITHKFVVSKSGVSLYKAYPVRWLMVVIGTFSALAAAILFMIIFEKIYKPIKLKNAENQASA